ncbi:MAG: BACON domain-containing protein [Bacteroidales bacterium]|nr:BACON domain-containing protein [Bacteroidales bacterium]
MRKAFAIIIPAILLAFFAAQFTACEKYVLPDLTITPDTLWFSAAADSQAINVNTNVITTLYPENSDSWVQARPEWLDRSRTVFIRVSENISSESRTAVIPVKSEAIQRNLVVIQEGLPEGE